MGSTLIAFHGCDVTTRDDLVSGRLTHLDHSTNQYDWLGPGAYFFEADVERALLFAKASNESPDRRYTARPIATPAVVGAVLQVQHWLDMTTQAGIREFSLAYAAMLASGMAIPSNRPAAEDDVDVIYRALDNAVFAWLHKARARQKPPTLPFQAVRGAFHQGPRIAPESGFHARTHIQIALRDNSCVVGWFLPAGASLLTEMAHGEAKLRLQAFTDKHKKRRFNLPKK